MLDSIYQMTLNYCELTLGKNVKTILSLFVQCCFGCHYITLLNCKPSGRSRGVQGVYLIHPLRPNYLIFMRLI